LQSLVELFELDELLLQVLGVVLGVLLLRVNERSRGARVPKGLRITPKSEIGQIIEIIRIHKVIKRHVTPENVKKKRKNKI